MTFVHATCIGLRRGRAWAGVLLRGPSGAGKSDLALRLIDSGARLIADDQTHLERTGRALIATAPPALAGLLEVRGVGIVRLAPAQRLARAPLALLVDLVAAERVERLPELARESVLGITLPVVALAAFEASAPAKLRLALRRGAVA